MALKQQVKIGRILIAVGLAALVYVWPLALEPAAHMTFAIFALAAALWLLEAIPLFLTSLLIPVLLILGGVFGAKDALHPFFDPIIALFLGGLLIAIAIQKLGLDKYIAVKFCGRARNSFSALLLLMVIVAFLSMWISNTAATAIMIPIGLVLAKRMDLKNKSYQIAVVLGIAFASNIGGMGTIVGSPPNALTVGLLDESAGIQLSFLDWMKVGLPLVIIMLPVAWWFLLKIFRLKKVALKLKAEKVPRLTGRAKIFLGVFVLTVLLWLTGPLHGISSSVVALMAAIMLFLLGFLNEKDINKVSWSTLILFGGGLTLGSAITKTGLAQFFADTMGAALSGSPALVIIVGVIVFSIVLGAIGSNTATAAILIPVMIPLGAVLPEIGPLKLALLTGLAVSMDFLLPVGTPPNALAYATGLFRIKDMLKAGVPITLAAVVIFSALAYFFW